MPPQQLHEFQPFSPLHLAVLAAFISLVTLLCLLGRRRRREGRDGPLRRAIGLVALLVFIAHQVYWLLPGSLDWSRSLPLHVCDLAGLAAALAFLTRRRIFRTLLYFWGVCLCSQGFITPTLTRGPASPVFWFFFLSHGVIVGGAIYECVAGGYAPTRRDLLAAIAVTAAYIVIVLPVNIATGWNYGYVGDAPTSQPTLINLLGPWPWRVGVLMILGALAFTLAWLPWELARRMNPGAQHQSNP